MMVVTEFKKRFEKMEPYIEAYYDYNDIDNQSTWYSTLCLR